MSYPIVVSKNVLNDDQWTLFNNELEESQIDYLQKYPRRLFSTEKHQQWLLDTFEDYIASVRQHCEYSDIQQAFVGLELPGSHFFHHRSHPNIAAVACIALDDMPPQQACGLELLTNSFDEPEDYLFGSNGYESVQYNFEVNTAFLIINTEPRYHWGFMYPIPKGHVRRSVWLYFGR